MLLSKKHKLNSRKIHLATYSHENSVIAEQYRNIRTNIKFITNNKKNSAFLITSADDGEGKSTTIANLAVSIAKQKEDRVLLIDADLRRSILHRIFNISNETGLTNVLKGFIQLEEAIKVTYIDHLDVLTSGTLVSNPTELLGSELMTNLLKHVTAMYDVVLIDSPSLLKSTETRVLANQCSEVILVVNRGKTEMENAIEAKRILELAHAPLMGVIFNDK